ncbi:MAG: membrane protein insertase YidC [Candidatus Ancillula trichonymphae]|jgi:YidC/Oxa1 family membrane protein insertase|nr:membrane protein insertase YidC [Candidatus Ancillula trichonymphae]
MLEILKPIEIVMSYIFYYIHDFLTLVGFNVGSGIAWIFSIVMLTILIRVCILPVFIKTIHSTRKMQAIQPQIQAIQKKYKNKKDQASREALSRETMALYKKEGANPFGSCLPLLSQAPFFLALYRTLNSVKEISEGAPSIGKIDKNIAKQIENSSFFSLNLSDTFYGIGNINEKIILVFLVLVICLIMFISQKVVTQRNVPLATKDNPMYKTQKMMIYIFPIITVFPCLILPIGILIYMLTTNIWTLLQGIWQIYFIPTPGSEAAISKEERTKKKSAQKNVNLSPEEFEKYKKPDVLKTQRKQPSKKGKRK